MAYRSLSASVIFAENFIMKKLIIALFTLFVSLAGSAQSYSGTVEFQKVLRETIVNSIPFPEKVVMGSIEDTMQKLGYKGKEVKDFIVYRGVKLPDFNNMPLDLYFMAERKSKKEKELSIVTLMVSKGFDDFITRASNAELVAKAKVFMDSLRNAVGYYDLELQISEQETVMKDNAKKSNDLVAEAEDLQKKKKKLEKEIEDNTKQQANMKSDTEKQQQILETLKSRRRQ